MVTLTCIYVYLYFIILYIHIFIHIYYYIYVRTILYRFGYLNLSGGEGVFQSLNHSSNRYILLLYVIICYMLLYLYFCYNHIITHILCSSIFITINMSYHSYHTPSFTLPIYTITFYP